MGRTVAINQDKLKMLKEIVVDNHDIISHKNVYVNEASPEASEFELCIEDGDQPLGGGYVHVKEGLQELRPNVNETTFETWFGNSVLKDENGLPLKMYHGTSEDFNTFSKEFIGRSGAYEGYGFNFTPFKSRAMGYNSKNVIEAYLKVENPMTSKTNKITLRQLMSIIRELDKGKPFTDTIVAAYEPARYNENWDAAYYKRALPTAARAIYDYNKEYGYGDAGLYAELCLNGQADTLETISAFEKMGYDAAIFYDNDDRINTVVVFEPNQIKRTTNKTFNPNSDIMDEDNAINEGYCGSKLKYIDLSDVGLVNYEWYFDEDEYNEWLADNELTDSEETRHEYYVNEVTYEVEYCDNYTQHTMDVDENVSYSDLEELFGENMAEKILSNCIKYGGGKFETFEMYEDSDYDVNNPQELNDIAVKLFSHGEYYKDCRGFILTNGVVIYTPSEHNEITILNNVNDKSDFVRMGNIRVLPNSINIYTEPTYEQELVLRDVIDSYSDDELFLDICNKDDCCGVRYDHPNWRYVLGEIERYYSEGIRPQGNQYFESKNSHKETLNESQESKSIAAAKKLVMQRLGYNEQQADEFVRVKLRNDIPALSEPKPSKFILGAARMFCDGELRSANDINNLNKTLELVSSDAHINEYDRNLNGLSAKQLIDRFAKVMNDNLEGEKGEVEKMTFNNTSDYQIVRIDSFKDAKRYGKYTSWCVTHDKGMFDSYTCDGINQFYFCLKPNFKSVKRVKGETYPSDEYGLSMIAVSVDDNGWLHTCTCRWNHGDNNDGACNDKFIKNMKGLAQFFGFNPFEVFKPNGKWQELINNATQRIANGESPQDVFDECSNFCEGFSRVILNDRYNYIDKNGNYLSKQWFDWCNNFNEGVAKVKLNEKYNYIDKNGNYLSEEWFDFCTDFHEGFGIVRLNDRYNYIDKSGTIISKQWFDWCYTFNNGFAIVRLNNKYNHIDKSGNYLSKQWFNGCGDFNEGFAVVILNGKYNFIDKNGDYLSDQWFEWCDDFSEGFAPVKLNDKRNFIDKSGNYLSDRWFDGCTYFREGFAMVQLNGEYYRIDKNGNLSLFESINNKKILVSEEQLVRLRENSEFEVDSSEIDLSSFKKKHELVPNIWKPNGKLNSRVRLKLLDIADDFWHFVNLTWVKPKSIILTGSICNFNWSQYSDIDLHLIVDFNEIDEKTEFVKNYLDSKKNEWNNEHDNLNIMGFNVELYVQDIDEESELSSVYDLETDEWIKEPNPEDIHPIGLNKFNIKKKAAEIMTIIDDMCDSLSSTDDLHKIEQISDDADYLWSKIKNMRKKSLEQDGEMGSGNIVYKYMRRKGYLDKLWDLRSLCYDRKNSINEGIIRFDMFDAAKKMFGVTNDIRECGFILPDGTMLDFSGKNITSYNVGRRTIYHRSIEQIEGENTPTVTLSRFIEAGAIRCDVKGAFINLIKRPTKEQISILSKFILECNGRIQLEIGDDDISIDYVEYNEGTPYKRIINDILNFFDSKIKPSSLYVNESKDVIKEYLEKDHNLPLYKYFKWADNASPCEKAEDLAYSCAYFIGEYIEGIYYRYNEFEELLDDGDFNAEDEEMIEKFLTLLKKYKLCDHFISIMRDIVCGASLYNELPTWCYTTFNRLVKNEWCIHFGNDAMNIANEGFTGGTDDIAHIAYTGAGQKKSSEGYNFAFSILDRSVDTNEYGDEAVIFRTSGVEVYHYGDNQNQVIFWGPNAHDFIPIKFDGYQGDWVVTSRNGRILKSGKPSDIAIWATENLPQYRKQIMTGKSGYIPMRYDSNLRKRVPLPFYRNESIKKYLKLLKENMINEEWVGDGNASHNPYKKHWDAERKALKDFVSNYGQLMQSKENGKLYKCYYDATLSQLIGFNYCICVQWDSVEMKPKSTLYIRACDKFTSNIKQVQFDTRGRDNTYGTHSEIKNNCKKS